MSSRPPRISVIIPSRSAPASLATTLQALAHQTLPAEQYEVFVAAGVDEEVVRRRLPPELPYSLGILVCPGPGAARRRNAGAKAARAEILVFLDDDMEPEPQLLAAHVAAHEDARAHGLASSWAVMGYLPPAESIMRREGSVDWLAAALRDWWEEAFEAMAQPSHRFSYADVLSGNLSLPAVLFHQVGGFAENYTCREDYELGVRLLHEGAGLRLSLSARSYHRDTTDIPRLLQRKTDEGRADIQLARQYPHVRPSLAFAIQFDKLDLASRILRYGARRWPPLAELATRLLTPLLGMSERLRLRYTWRRLLGGLLVYAYWRGVLQMTRDWDEIRALTAGPAPSLGVVDLAGGMAQVEKVLELCPVHGVRITWRGLPLGRIGPAGFAEPVNARHVAAWLREQGAVAVARAKALEILLGIVESAHEPLLYASGSKLAAMQDLCPVQPCPQPAPILRASTTHPEWVLEVNLAEGRIALAPLLTTFSQQVLVRQADQQLGWLQLPACAEARTLGEVIYALLAQLSPSTWLA
jgi:GT2 family glycosyltransferase